MKKLLSLLFVLMMMLPAAVAEEEKAPLLEVHQMVLGYADGYFIRVGDIEIMIDGGKPVPFANNDDVLNNLTALGATELDMYIITHWHLDHCENVNVVLEEFGTPETVVYSPSEKVPEKLNDGKHLERFLYVAPLVNGVYRQMKQGDVIEIGPLTIYCVGPANGGRYGRANADSLNFVLQYGTRRMLFTGDYAASGNMPLTVIGMGGGAAAAVLGYRMFAHVKVRVAMWRNPWSDPLDKGYQIIQALLAIGSGGLFGVGLGQGTPDKIPAYYNDFIFAVVCEQMGLVFGLLLLAVYLLLILRGVSVITRSRRSLHMLLGCGVLVMLSVQTFMIVAGVIKMIPLTGVTMPFLSYGGSSLISCLSMIGIVHGIAGRAQADMEEDILSIRK